MYLTLFLRERLELEVDLRAPLPLTRGGREFADVSDDWGDSFFLGFYDWLRTADETVVGIRLTLHDGRESLRELLPAWPYVSWLAPSIVEIMFSDADGDIADSVDQEFSESRCLRSADGEVALVFDASQLSSEQLQGPLLVRG